jgi:hypothetical protein
MRRDCANAAHRAESGASARLCWRGYVGASTIANAITSALNALADADRVDAAQAVEKCVTYAARHDADIYGATLRALNAERSRQ